MTFTDKKAETLNITASVNGDSQSGASTFVADSGSAKVNDLTVTTGALANGAATNQATVTVLDLNNNPLANVDVTWSQDGSAVLATSAKTDASGKTTVTFTDKKAETVNITATVDGGSSQTKPAEFVADSSTAKLSKLTVTSGAAANGTATNQATVTVTDASNNPLANMDVSWSQDGSAVLGSSAKTDAIGKTTVTFTDVKAETVNITANVNGDSQSGASTFVADSGSAKVNDLTVTTGALANGTATNQATVTILDLNNNPLANVDVTWSQDGSAVLGTSAKTDASGKTTVTFTDTKAETVNITATVNSSTATKGSEFIADASTAQIIDMGTTTGAVADGSATNKATVTVTDKNGNALSGQNVAWSSDKSAQFSASSTATGSDGKATVDFTDQNAETTTITAMLDNGNNQAETSTFVAPMLMTLTADNEGVLESGGEDTIKLTAKVVDSHGKPLSGQKVTWHSSEDIHGISSSVTTDAEGIATATVYSEAPHSGVIVSASTTDKQGRDVDSNDVTIEFYDVVVHVQNSQKSLNVGGTSTIDVSLTRGRDTPITASHPIYFDITSGAGSLNGAGAHVVGYTDSQGKYSAALTSSVAGSVTVRVKYDSGSYYDDTITFR